VSDRVEGAKAQSRSKNRDEGNQMKTENRNEWLSKRFGIKAEDVLDYNSGSAYDKIWVTNRAAAEKVSKKVESGTCNGGYFHGMSLGNISEYDGKFEVMV